MASGSAGTGSLPPWEEELKGIPWAEEIKPKRGFVPSQAEVEEAERRKDQRLSDWIEGR